ncbi:MULTISPECIES: TetR/AcrR family transcriptional regulator [Rhizobium]|uniref:TetR/AcrR family transcriptional regulator n=1 Tax=Rhizobium TaxID=379 RepID=UPI001B326D00|nr:MULTISPECIES: TetR/AcrR family transcriptional regulator [Rhizobium]MBX4909081.1 TetR/AcrR family transcriptional regulator [Rhizobium bangladeshense]MBX5214723.1 TetR/AcrR family transcriptional regulator [Rhizobium sp. NLR9a]MBX5231887.1 TetR/AcrR family transcriptional regulator [Rhizobium sp. NLR4a]MBX5237201.1 TetR/AcrR family transcriptional regulator [Rhizobium sp. NLR22b]MBX5244138.1 TetR/AcrR family transcriptional regulator [Rhizobium sp. NLR3b]
MSGQPAATRRRHQDHSGQPRRIPRQQRGRERFEKILAVAAELIESHGSDGLKMSEIVEKAGLSFGALYQYFPDKSAIIRTLAERFNEEGRRCVEAELAKVVDAAALPGALARIVDEYYAFFRREPVMRDIWHATHTDKLLQQVDAEDMEFHAQAFLALLVRLWPDRDRSELQAIARLTMQLLAAAVRYAVSLDAEEGARTIALFKTMQGPDIGRLLLE